MKYANIAVDAPVDNTFDYHLPPELEGEVEPGHLVQVPFGTALQHGIVLSLHDDTPIEKTKPVHSLIDPRPIVTPDQIEIARWLSKSTLAPIGLCLWMWLPPGLTGHQDIEVTLIDENAEQNGKPAVESALEAEIVALLKKRRSMRGTQFNQALHGKNWRNAVDGLARAGVVHKQPILTPPKVKPKIVQIASLAIHPNAIEAEARRSLGVISKAADLLEWVAAHDGADKTTALKTSGAGAKHLDSLVADGLLIEQRERLLLGVPREDVQGWLDRLRRLDKPLRILRLLEREGDSLDVSWLYAQADCTLADLKKLEDEGLILLAEKQKWRDSLEEKTFVPRTPPTLTPEQQAAWKAIEAALGSTSPPAPPRIRATPPPSHSQIQGGEFKTLSTENYRGWSVPADFYPRLKPLMKELRLNPTPAEEFLWQHIRQKQLTVKFRRQHPIERFVVDFYTAALGIVVEVDGEYHQYTQEEEAIRQEYLELLGLRVIRLTNEQVLEHVDEAIAALEAVIEERQRAIEQKRLAPLPEFGEGMGERSPAPFTAFLLHGVTGSGKTEIYLRAIDRALKNGQTAIFLVPEIALTAQTVRRVAARFPGKVGVVHSRLSEGERYDTWRRARDGIVQVIVGARSALFTPLPNLGLIILDECHDDSYKQSPPVQPPYYHARETAEAILKQTGGVLILGSATPDVETYYRGLRGEIQLLDMPSRILGHRIRIEELGERSGVEPRYRPDTPTAEDALTIDLPPVRVVDMREELKAGNTSIFSRPLQDSLAEVLRRREQAILFLNRRGQATYVFCRDCGYVANCPRCDTPLTHHRAGEVLRCHRCGFSQPEPTVCPQCSSRRIKYFGAGTQQVEMALAEMFPLARIARWDADTADSPEAHEAILQRFIDRKTDVMIGTQMVAKGLDLPLVTLVGVISADVGIYLPDFRAGERAFQVLTQVAGRAGRGLLGGEVILQTYSPAHYAIQAASRHDFRAFYEKEIAYRREMGYPPFRDLVRILFRFPTEMQAQAEAERAANMIRHRLKILNMSGTELIGPAPCFFGRENKLFRWQLLLRGPDPVSALRDLNLPKGWHVDVNPVEIL